MTEKTEEQGFNSREALRKGFLAYVGLYGTAYDRARKFVDGKGSAIFNDFVKKGEEVEDLVQGKFVELRERAEEKYAEQIDGIEKFFSRVSNDDASKAKVRKPASEKKRAAATKAA